LDWDTVERRRSGEHTRPLPREFERIDRTKRPPDEPEPLLDPETGFFTMSTLAEFIQYEIDGSAQTLRNELHITPLCLAAVEVVGGPDVPEAREKFDKAVHDAIRQLTRTADRAARNEQQIIMLLRRTMAASLKEHFAPRLQDHIGQACADFGPVNVHVGISSLVEHLAKSPDHLVRMAQRALEEAKMLAVPAVVYDFRVMLVT
jgi:hypothetical protein